MRITTAGSTRINSTGSATNNLSRLPMTPQPFGFLPTGEAIEKYTLRNAGGASLEFITYGGIVTA